MPEQIAPCVEGDALVIPIAAPWEETIRRLRRGFVWFPLLAFIGVLMFAPTSPLAWVLPFIVFFIVYRMRRSAMGLKGQTGQVRINERGLTVHYPALLRGDIVVDAADIKNITCHAQPVPDARIALLGLRNITVGMPTSGSVLVEMTDKVPNLQTKPGSYMPSMDVIYDDGNATRFTYVKAFQWQPGSGVGLETLQQFIDGAREGRMPTPQQLTALEDVWGSDMLSYEERIGDRRAQRRAAQGQQLLKNQGRRGMPAFRRPMPGWIYPFVERLAYVLRGLWFRKPKD